MAKIAFGVPVHQERRTWFTYPLRIDAKDVWSVHVIGTPGFGKSVHLGNLAEQCLDAGAGVLLIDVKGALARDVVERTKHTDRLIYVAPAEAAEHNHYWSFNPLEFDRNDRRLFQVYQDALPSILTYIGGYDPSIEAIIDTMISEGITLALVESGTCLLDIFQILHDEAFRDRLLRKRNVHPLTYHFWRKVFGTKSLREQHNLVDSTDRRLRRIIRPTYLNYALNQPKSTLKLAEWLDEGRLVVCNFDQAEMGHLSARYFGNLLLGYLAVVAEQRPTGQTARPWYLIVDEFHQMATDPFAEMIEQLRTYNVFPIIANQNWGQLSGKMKAAAEQCHVKVELRLSSSDADVIRRRGSQEEADDRVNFDKYIAIVDIAAVGPRGSRRKERVKLLPWWADPPEAEKKARLEAAKSKQLEMTDHKRDLVNLWDRFPRDDDGSPGRGTKEGHDRRDRPTNSSQRPRQGPPPRPNPLQSRPGPDLPDGNDSAGMAGAGSVGPVPVPDQRTAGQTPLLGPDQHQGRGARRRRGPQGHQRGVSAPTEGPAPGGVPPDLPPHGGRDVRAGGSQHPDAQGPRPAPGAPPPPRPGARDRLASPPEGVGEPDAQP
ncbi:MAG: type IV secretory system conjugative DNA transfer family protein [Chloroflexota bacterium]|nr:type IV secretory system conjugative DNA transfer family protein [Chloroflexota bacterium]